MTNFVKTGKLPDNYICLIDEFMLDECPYLYYPICLNINFKMEIQNSYFIYRILESAFEFNYSIFEMLLEKISKDLRVAILASTDVQKAILIDNNTKYYKNDFVYTLKERFNI